MSNRRAQDERIEGTPDGVNAISEIVDVPDTPTIGTATAGIGDALVAFTPATTGGTVSLFTATSSPGSITGTSATSPITVSGLTGGTEYTFTVSGENSTGTGPFSSASNSITAIEVPGAYDSLADITVPSGGAASITFAGIPSGYKHLQLRGIARGTTSGDYGYLHMTFNGDNGSNYAYHNIAGNGASASSSATASAPYIRVIPVFTTDFMIADAYDSFIIDILDYASVSKNKTSRNLFGHDNNNNGVNDAMKGIVGLTSGLWMNSSTAINSITFVTDINSFKQYSSFALYGVK